MNKVRLQYTKEYGGPNKGRIKNEKYLEMSFFCIGQASVHP